VLDLVHDMTGFIGEQSFGVHYLGLAPSIRNYFVGSATQIQTMSADSKSTPAYKEKVQEKVVSSCVHDSSSRPFLRSNSIVDTLHLQGVCESLYIKM
jgi:hypothetical protein